ncbi:MAG: TolC family protein, partial [Myxococcota bacterium]
AAVGLSLLYRDEQGEPIVPAADQLPDALALFAPPVTNLESDIVEAWQQRPDLRAVDAMLEQSFIELRVARNQLLPDVRISGVASQDYGTGEDPETKSPFEIDAGLSVEIPLFARKARGRVGAAQADITRLEADQQLLKDTVRVELQTLWTEVQATWEQRQFAEQAFTAASEVAELERRNFELGGGDLFRVNKREEDVAKAAKNAIEARYRYLQARAAYAAALNESLQSP